MRPTLNHKCRLCRAEGAKLYLKGSRCLSSKCPLEKRGAVPPGMHGVRRMKKPTDFGIQLRAKQKAKRIYAMQETQFNNYFKKAKKLKGILGDNFLILLDRRLDNVVYSAGLSLSRSHARQLISHRHVLVNGRIVNIPSYSVKINDKITLEPKNAKNLIANLKIADKDFQIPSWLSPDAKKTSVTVSAFPGHDDLKSEIDVNLIIESYSR